MAGVSTSQMLEHACASTAAECGMTIVVADEWAQT